MEQTVTYTREHDLASVHPLKLAAEKKADAAVKRLRKSYRAKANKLRVKAEAMLAEASELDYLANKHSEYETPFAKLRDEIEDAGYWAAREVIGTLPRDDDGNYVDPAPKWRASYNGEFIGIFQGEERYDVLREICPPKVDDRNWSDFEIERVE